MCQSADFQTSFASHSVFSGATTWLAQFGGLPPHARSVISSVYYLKSMKFISDTQYEAMTSEIAILSQELRNLKEGSEVKALHETIGSLNNDLTDIRIKLNDSDKKVEEQRSKIEDLHLVIKSNNAVHSDEITEKDRKIKRLESDNDLAIREALKEQGIALAKTVAERDQFKAEADMLRTAFKNLGFDVKDMKEIMSKLVEGVVAKNTVNVIK